MYNFFSLFKSENKKSNKKYLIKHIENYLIEKTTANKMY